MLVRQDPYGSGWLMRIHVPDEEGTTRNLIPKNLVAGWMRDTAQRLTRLQPQLAGAVAAEGGRPVEDIATALGAASWKAARCRVLPDRVGGARAPRSGRSVRKTNREMRNAANPYKASAESPNSRRGIAGACK